MNDETVPPSRPRLFCFDTTFARDPDVERWFASHSDDLGAVAKHWFDVLRNRGSDVREILHDGQPTACVGNAAFAYVDTFTSHVNIGFFLGALLPDPDGLLQGTGKFMRHVKLTTASDIDTEVLTRLIEVAYKDMQERREAE